MSLLFLFLMAIIAPSKAHVALLFPPGRTNNDYLYTYDGSCEGSSCDAFCGDPYSDDAPITTLQVGVPITLRWISPVPHKPNQYRLSLNQQGSDGGFDVPEHILATVKSIDASSEGDDESSNRINDLLFSTQVTIPRDALDGCAGPSPCVLQLFDLYYFVSCANVFLTDNNVTSSVDMNVTPQPLPSIDIDIDIDDDTTVIRVEAASFTDYRVTLGDQTPQLDPTLELQRCDTYTFVIDAPGHPFVIKTAPGVGWDNLFELAENNGGMDLGTFQFTIPATAPSTLFYQCTLHPEMVGTITVVGGDEDACKESATDGSSSGSPLTAHLGGCVMGLISGFILLVL